MKFEFRAKIYKTGINWCVNVPLRISKRMIPVKGYIKIKGQINNYDFTKSLVPVKNKPYRLFVNAYMMKGGETALGKVARFSIEQTTKKEVKNYSTPKLLRESLKKEGLTKSFNQLTPSRKKDILKYLSFVKTDETMKKNVNKLIAQLKAKKKNVRVP